ncbi:hypothetical protein OFN60_37955, partial [Escherichia coli]|nr:hypothetical protein [Escherichia coli]
LGLASASATLHEDYRTEPEARHLGRALGPRFTVNTLHPDDPPGTPPGLPMVVVRLADRSFVIATLPRSPGPRGGALIATLVFLA